MGHKDDGLLDTYDRIIERGDPFWWLYMSQCRECSRYALVAREERHNDIWLVLSLDQGKAFNIINKSIWPEDFNKYETLLEI